jgi:hypothetical protein
MRWLKVFGVLALAAASTFVLAACIAEMKYGEHVDGFVPYLAVVSGLILGWSSVKLARLFGVG